MKGIAAALMALAAAACATAGLIPAGQIPVKPAESFPGDYINIKAPNSEGWYLIQSSDSGMAFGKAGLTKPETFVAGVNMFNLPLTNTPAEFEDLIRKTSASDTPLPERYEVLRETFKYTDERGYPCVRYELLAKDKPPGSDTPLLLALDGLYCRHPKRPDAGFSAIYSFRGKAELPTLHTEAQSFVDEVQVPR